MSAPPSAAGRVSKRVKPALAELRARVEGNRIQLQQVMETIQKAGGEGDSVLVLAPDRITGLDEHRANLERQRGRLLNLISQAERRTNYRANRRVRERERRELGRMNRVTGTTSTALVRYTGPKTVMWWPGKDEAAAVAAMVVNDNEVKDTEMVDCTAEAYDADEEEEEEEEFEDEIEIITERVARFAWELPDRARGFARKEDVVEADKKGADNHDGDTGTIFDS